MDRKRDDDYSYIEFYISISDLGRERWKKHPFFAPQNEIGDSEVKQTSGQHYRTMAITINDVTIAQVNFAVPRSTWPFLRVELDFKDISTENCPILLNSIKDKSTLKTKFQGRMEKFIGIVLKEIDAHAHQDIPSSNIGSDDGGQAVVEDAIMGDDVVLSDVEDDEDEDEDVQQSVELSDYEHISPPSLASVPLQTPISLEISEISTTVPNSSPSSTSSSPSLHSSNRDRLSIKLCQTIWARDHYHDGICDGSVHLVDIGCDKCQKVVSYCSICKFKITLHDRNTYHYAHIKSHHGGGHEIAENMIVICRGCNSRMKSTHLCEFIKSEERYRKFFGILK